MKRGYHGTLEITAIDRAGNRYVYATANTITYDARKAMAHLLVGEDYVNRKVTKLALGTGATAPVRGNTALQIPLLVVPADSIVWPADGQVEFTTTLDFLSPANGSILTEAGLISNDETKLFARQVYTATPKDENFRLEFRWRIVFT